MTAALPILYEFPHSHFCEVARWALDYTGVAYRSVPLMPGLHIARMKKLCGQSSVPVLVDGERVVPGSAAIVDYLEAREPARSLDPGLPRENVVRLEQEMAARLGVPVRRLCYYHLLPHARLVRYFFMHRSGRAKNLLFRAMYPGLSKRLVAVYDCTPEGAASAQDALTEALAYYDAMLANQDYLGGDSFSRLDLTFAALLAHMVMPPEFPVAWPEELRGQELTQWFQSFRDSASYRHVESVYRAWRRA